MSNVPSEKQTEEGLGLWDKVKGAVTRPRPDDYYETNLDNATGFLSRNKDKTPLSVKAASFMAEATPVIGDAIAAKEVWDELQKAEPNYYLVGALGGATVVGLFPGVGDSAAKAIKKGAEEVFDVARRVEIDPNAMGSMGGNIRLRPKPEGTTPRFNEEALRTAANQNDKSREILVEMPIDDFLKSAEKGLVESKLEGTRALVAEGTPFSSIPNLTFKNNGDGTAKVVAHEGRHRALALKEQGETTIPVTLTSRGGDGPAIRWGQQNDPDSFDYVDVIPQKLIEEDGTGLVSMPSAASEIRAKPASNLDNWSKDAYFKDPDTGKPQQMYHGMGGTLRGESVEFVGDNLEPSYAGTLGPGTYISNDPSVASDFATGKRGAGYTDEKFGGQVFPVYTNVTKVVDDDVINSNKALREEVASRIEDLGDLDDNYVHKLVDRLRSDEKIDLSSLYTRVEDGKVRSSGVGGLVSETFESSGYEAVSVVTDKGFHEAVIFQGHGGLKYPKQNIKSTLQGPDGAYSRETNDMRFAEGGLATSQKITDRMLTVDKSIRPKARPTDLKKSAAPLMSRRPKTSPQVKEENMRGLDVEFHADMNPILKDDPIARAGFDPDQIDYTESEGNNASYSPRTDRMAYGSQTGASEDVIAHEARHRGFKQLLGMRAEDPKWFEETYGKDSVMLLDAVDEELAVELRDNPDASWNTGKLDKSGKPVVGLMSKTLDGATPEILREFINTGKFNVKGKGGDRISSLLTNGLKGLEEAASDMLMHRGEPDKARMRGTKSYSSGATGRWSQGGPVEMNEGGVIPMSTRDDGGLATDGLTTDPVSGNNIPAGSNAEDVRDDVDAKLSAGEYVVPADVVKYFGVAHFEKLRDKAKSGMEEMESDGRIGGDSGGGEMPKEHTLSSDVEAIDSYAVGGLVDGADVDGIIDRVKAAAMKDPSIVNMLKAKGISIATNETSPPSIQGQNTPRNYAEGGEVDGDEEDGYEKSTFDPYAHLPGFSLNRAAPTATAPVCPDGYAWNEDSRTCEPTEDANAVGTTGSSTSEREGPGVDTGSTSNEAWMDAYDYDNPESVYRDTMKSLSQEEEAPSEGFFGRLGDKINERIQGSVLGRIGAAAQVSIANANAVTLRGMGLTKEADEIEAAAAAYAQSYNIPDSLKGLMDGSKRAASIAARREGKATTAPAVKSGRTTTATGGEGNDDTRTSGGYTSSDVSAPSYSPSVAATASQASYSPGGYGAAESAAKSAGSVSKDTAESLSGAQMSAGSGVGSEEDGSNYAGPMNRGGLIKPRKKAKAKPTAKKKGGGLGSRP